MRPDATPDEVRRAYHRRARELHPDAVGPSSTRGAFTIQDVNEAWRILRDPNRRRAYDRSLRPTEPPRPSFADDPGWDPDADLDPTPYRHAVADPHDVGIRVVRHLPWLVLVAVLGLIFVFTAYAGSGDDDGLTEEGDLLGRCVRIVSADDLEEVPCSGPNDGEVVLIDFEGSGCPSGTTPHTLRAGGRTLCLRAT